MSKLRGVGGELKSFNSFSGVDIKAVMGNTIIGELQAISYSISREKAPLYTMGSADPRAYSRGKRGIAGTLIFLMFDRHSFLGHFGVFNNDLGKQYQPYLDDDEEIFGKNLGSPELNIGSEQGTVGNSSAALLDLPADADGTLNFAAGQQALSGLDGDSQLSALTRQTKSFFSDQVLPFDVTLAAANEYGALAVMRIYGCEILNEGYGVSIDDIVSEQQMSYIARSLSPWTAIKRKG
ncbi:MAG: hypothetical protein CMB80_04400 [Flammeovirgaceae bacterium]|nr:hypothetical protein [Flammeovirgaceae bacterium]|tara:strand:+ start:6581 stop:7291 length:711 start_codon:yes stop_codon:yes gene_type:complete